MLPNQCLAYGKESDTEADGLSYGIEMDETKRTEIEELVQSTLKKSKVPAASIVIVNKDQTYRFAYGNTAGSEEDVIDEHSLFELGSMSKAFTALGILQLQQEGKLSLDDPVTKYIPWLTMRFKGNHEGTYIDEEVTLKLSDFLYHTSGIPFQTIGFIPAGDSEQMLESTVKDLKGIQLDFYPGSKYRYATINYDVLGLVIQEVSKMSYEEYIETHILNPLGLFETRLFRSEEELHKSTVPGYKMNFFRSMPYTAPFYRGNTPAGYIVSNTADMEHWMRIQLGLINIPDSYQELIDSSHIGNTTVPSGEYYYAAGWEVHVSQKKIIHGGTNPNYSSMIVMKPQQDLGICVLTNMNSNAAEYLADNIIHLLEGKSVAKYKSDSYKSLDTVFSIIIIVFFLFGLLFFVLLVQSIMELVQGKRTLEKMSGSKIAGILLAVALMAYFGFCVYYLPNVLMNRLPWAAVDIWCSSVIQYGCFIAYIAFVIFMCFVLITFQCPKDNEKNYLTLIPLSVANGLASALIIFTINESFNRNLEYSKELFVYFVLSLIFFVYTQKLIQGRMIVITNELAYEKRTAIIDRVIHSPFETIEDIGQERIFSGLNNDTSAVSKIPEVVVSFASNLLTLAFCLAYLLSKSIYAFLATAMIIVLNGLLSVVTGYLATKHWEKNRDIQDVFFGQMTDLIYGFKELVLNRARRIEFWKTMQKSARQSADYNKSASVKFLNFDLYNTLMYNIVFGVVVFIFPLIIFDMNVNELRENLFIVFYMIGPFSALASSVSQITQLRVNMKRINQLLAELELSAEKREKLCDDNSSAKENPFRSMELEQVIYQYNSEGKDSSEETFTLGPVNAKFYPGEITFIVGGNGSGKSTLGKLITGIYKSQEGVIKLNGKKTDTNTLNEYFSAVYADFHLFGKLYGMDYQTKKPAVYEYLKQMKLDSKVKVDEDGNFHSIALSTGQKKRLAFIVCCLEDKPIMLFDEWAAEQDPEFRQYFYMELLPNLKERSKCIIVITHDDRYFDTADHVLKLEYGELI